MLRKILTLLITPEWLGFRLVAVVALVVFLAELAIMMLVTQFDLTAHRYIWLFDAMLVTVLTVPVVYVVLARPLVHQVRALQKAQARQRLQVAAMEAAAHGLIITDQLGRIEYANPATCRLTGYERSELEGNTANLLNSGHHPSAFFHDMWEQILAGQPWTGEIVNRRKDGTLYSEEQTITPVCDELGRVSHFVAVKRDITTHKEAAAALAERNEALLALSRAEYHQRQLAEALVSATTAVTGSLELTRVLDLILDQTQRLIPCRTAAILMVCEELIEIARIKDDGPARPLEDHPLTRAFALERFPRIRAMVESPQITRHDDTLQDPTWSTVPGVDWIRSLVAAPITGAGRVVGLLVVLSDQPHYFHDDTVRSLSALAGHAMVAIQNAQLFSNELRARYSAETLAAASIAMTQTLNVEAICRTLLEFVKRLLPYEGAYVALQDTDMRFQVRVVDGYGSTLPPSVALGTQLDPVECEPLNQFLRNQTLTAGNRANESSERPCLLSPASQSYVAIPLIAGNVSLGFFAIEHSMPDVFDPQHRPAVEALTALAAVTVHNALLYEQVTKGHARQQSLAHRLVEVQEAERRQVARELHDEAGQALSSLILGLGQLERELIGLNGLGQTAAELRQLADDVWDNLHSLAIDLRPADLDHLGLVEALRSYIARVNQQNGLRVDFKATGLEQRLTQEVETALYRIAQEALTNVSRHAHARRADVLLQQRGAEVTLIIEDNGQGFAVDKVSGAEHLGLLGMRERCEMLGGTLQIESTPGSGTTVVGVIPCGDSNSHCR